MNNAEIIPRATQWDLGDPEAANRAKREEQAARRKSQELRVNFEKMKGTATAECNVVVKDGDEKSRSLSVLEYAGWLERLADAARDEFEQSGGEIARQAYDDGVHGISYAGEVPRRAKSRSIPDIFPNFPA